MKTHLVKEIENPITRALRATVPKDDGRIDVKQSDIDVVKRGMENVTMNPSGTAYQVFRNAAYVSAGKTGTAQVFSLQGAKYHGHALAEHLRDHALFIAFAPADNPKIAIALIVENGGWGAQAAGPIARRVLDYYLVDRLKPGVEQAAVVAAASATEETSAPVIGSAPTAPTGEIQPVAVAAGFKPLPMPAGASTPHAVPASDASGAVAASGAASASAPVAASAAVPRAASASKAAKAPRVASATVAQPPAASDATATTAAAPVKASDARKSPRKPRPASDARPVAAAPSRNEDSQAVPRGPVSGGIDE